MIRAKLALAWSHKLLSQGTLQIEVYPTIVTYNHKTFIVQNTMACAM
jgi:hypothetical protein